MPSSPAVPFVKVKNRLLRHRSFQTIRSKQSHNVAVDTPPKDACSPSPCGANSLCRQMNGQAVCTCVPGFVGAPPLCRPECVVSSDCPQNQACLNQKCRDPCIGICGLGALCHVVNHSPICSCPPSKTGDPFVRCRVLESTS